MELTTEKQAINGTLLYALPNKENPKSYITGILEDIYASNKQVFLEAVLRARRIRVGRYIANERNYPFCFSWFVSYIYFKYKY